MQRDETKWYNEDSPMSGTTCLGRSMIDKARAWAEWTEKHQLLSKLHLPPKTTKAYMPTIWNGAELSRNTRNKSLGNGDGSYYKNGVELSMLGDGNYRFETWTVCDGVHVMNFHCVVDAMGKLVQGRQNRVNVFTGWMNIDQDYLDEYIDELSEVLDQKEQSRKWKDVITGDVAKDD